VTASSSGESRANLSFRGACLDALRGARPTRSIFGCVTSTTRGLATPSPRQPNASGWSRFPRKAGAWARLRLCAGAYAAVAIEVGLEHGSDRVRLVRAAAAVDSGQAVNPDGIRNQIEGAFSNPRAGRFTKASPSTSLFSGPIGQHRASKRR